MGITGETQLWNLLYACGLGFWIGLYYELFRTLRLLFPPTGKSCFFQDVFFCLTSALITFFCFLAIADGQMVPYLFIGEAVGFFAFYSTVGRVFHILLAALFRLLARWVFALSRWSHRLFSRLFSRPLEWLFRKRRAVTRRFVEKTAKIRKKVIFFSKKT